MITISSQQWNDTNCSVNPGYCTVVGLSNIPFKKHLDICVKISYWFKFSDVFDVDVLRNPSLTNFHMTGGMTIRFPLITELNSFTNTVQ